MTDQQHNPQYLAALAQADEFLRQADPVLDMLIAQTHGYELTDPRETWAYVTLTLHANVDAVRHEASLETQVDNIIRLAAAAITRLVSTEPAC